MYTRQVELPKDLKELFAKKGVRQANLRFNLIEILQIDPLYHFADESAQWASSSEEIGHYLQNQVVDG